MMPSRCGLCLIFLTLLSQIPPVYCDDHILNHDSFHLVDPQIKTFSFSNNISTPIFPTKTIPLAVNAFALPLLIFPTTLPEAKVKVTPHQHQSQSTGLPQSTGGHHSRACAQPTSQPFVRCYRRGQQGGAGGAPTTHRSVPQGASAYAVPIPDYFGSLSGFSAMLEQLTSLLYAEDNVIAIIADLDNTIHFSPGDLNSRVDKTALIQQQKEVMRLFRQWLEGLPELIRRRFLYIINTSRIVTTNPADAHKNGHLFLPDGRWPEALLSGMMPPDVLINRNGQAFHFFDSPFFRGRLEELISRVTPCWPPNSSEFSARDRKLLGKQLGTNGRCSPKCIYVFNHCTPVFLLREIALKCGAYMREYPSSTSECRHIHIYDVRINKGTAILHLLNQMLEINLLQGNLHFVTAGDDFPDLPMLFPQDYIGSLSYSERQATFVDPTVAERVLEHHAGSILSIEAGQEMKDAINIIKSDAPHAKATLPGLPGIIQQVLKILEERLNIYAF